MTNLIVIFCYQKSTIRSIITACIFSPVIDSENIASGTSGENTVRSSKEQGPDTENTNIDCVPSTIDKSSSRTSSELGRTKRVLSEAQLVPDDSSAPVASTSKSTPTDNEASTRNRWNILSPAILEEILNKSEEGKDIIHRAATGELSEAKQLQLAGFVANYHLNHRSVLHTEDLETYALAICTLFRFERKVS